MSATPLRVEFEDHLRQMRKAAAKPIKFHAKDNVNLPLAHSRHEPIKASPRKLRAGNRIAIFGGYAPTLTLAVVLQFEALRVGALVVGRDAIVKGDTFAHAFLYANVARICSENGHFQNIVFSTFIYFPTSLLINMFSRMTFSGK